MKHTILLADDSSTIQRLIERTFENTEFEVTAVSNGDAAVQAIPSLRPSAVLADIHMPGKNGYEVCEFVKSDPSLSSTPVILLVGAFEVFDEAEATRVGAERRVTKPFEPKQLHRTVAELVGARPAPTPPPRVPDAPGVAIGSMGGDPVGGPGSGDDVLGLSDLFPPDAASGKRALSEEEIDAIADRVISRLSSDVVESIAWDIVPEIADRIMRDEMKKQE
jgi:CheY-like chemotaxis protein